MTDEKFLQEFEELKRENGELLQRISELEGTNGSVPAETNTEANTEESDEWGSDLKLVDSDLYNEIQFEPDFGILFVSLVNHTLVLREQQKGGKEHIFTSFGLKKHIPYESAVKVAEYNKRFLEQGLFAILTQKFLDKFGIENAKVSLGTMNRMIEGSIPPNEFVTHFRGMPKGQQEEVRYQMVRRLMSDPDTYTGFFLLKLESELGLDLKDRAESSKGVIEAYKEAAKNGK